jgi:HAD superfamily hydrolase (TIGR01509 family)
MPSVPSAAPIRGVVFDFHHTLAHAGDPAVWLQQAWADLGREGDAASALGPSDHADAVAFLDRIWEHARDADPHSERDLDSRRHREVFDRTIARAPGIDLELADALYSIMHRQWDVYADVLPVLTALREKGVRVAMLSNVGVDLTPTLERTGVGALIDGAVMSYAVGVVKPDPGIFERALEILDLPASDVLMVGDAWRDDGGAAALGVRTLILPRTDDASHGLELVVRLV